MGRSGHQSFLWHQTPSALVVIIHHEERVRAGSQSHNVHALVHHPQRGGRRRTRSERGGASCGFQRGVWSKHEGYIHSQRVSSPHVCWPAAGAISRMGSARCGGDKERCALCPGVGAARASTRINICARDVSSCSNTQQHVRVHPIPQRRGTQSRSCRWGSQLVLQGGYGPDSS